MDTQKLRQRLQQVEVSDNNADELRILVAQIESRIKEVIGPNPFKYYYWFPKREVVEEVDELLKIRQRLLDNMFTWSNDEVKQIIRINGLLFDLTKKMYHRTAELYRAVLRNGRDYSFDDDYEIEGALLSGVEYYIYKGYADDSGTVLHYDNDSYYGSDFTYMLYVIGQNYGIRLPSNNIHECYVNNHEGDNPEMTDEELGCDYRDFDDGKTWAEYHNRPELKDVCICYAFHTMFDRQRYSLPDILRINSYDIEAKITCRHCIKPVN